MYEENFKKAFEYFIKWSNKIYVYSRFFTNNFNSYNDFLLLNEANKYKRTWYITFIYNDKVIKAFINEKYFNRYMINYFNFEWYEKIKILDKWHLENIYYIIFDFIETNKYLNKVDFYYYDFIKINYKKLYLSWEFKNIYTINSISIKSKNQDLYDFYISFLESVKEKYDNNKIEKLTRFLEENKEIFKLEKYLYFIHWDLWYDHFLESKNIIYIIDFWNSWYFDYHYDLVWLNIHMWFSDDEIKQICIWNKILFLEERYKFSHMLYELIEY